MFLTEISPDQISPGTLSITHPKQVTPRNRDPHSTTYGTNSSTYGKHPMLQPGAFSTVYR